MATKEEVLEKLKTGVVDFQEDDVKDASQEALDNGFDSLEMIMDGLAAGMEIVGDLYDRNEYFVPEVLMCADALYGGLDILRPHIPPKREEPILSIFQTLFRNHLNTHKPKSMGLLQRDGPDQ